MSVVAAVFTGANKLYTPQIYSYVYGLLPEGEGFAYIQYPGAEYALARAEGVMEQQRFAIFDILESHARAAGELGAEVCIIVHPADCNPGAPNFEKCKCFVRRQRDAVMEWNIFKAYRLACLTPRCGVVPIQ